MTDPEPVSGARAYWRLLRPYQWSKNLLIFLPPLLAHEVTGAEKLPHLVWAFICFSLAASAVYVLNDFVDVEADRRHPRKRFRPLASGAVPRGYAVPLSLALAGATLAAGAFLLPYPFLWVLAGYLAANVAYTFWCKHQPVLDVVVLTQMYVIRIVAGGVAAGVEVTDWLLGFSLFQFLSLAFAKRYAELLEARASGGAEGDLIRGYRLGDLAVVRILGVSSGMLAALVMALYIRSPDVLRLYTEPKLLWLVCSALIFWTGRLWLLADRGEMSDDPVAFALRDRASYWTGLFLAAVVLAAKQLSL
ncbi:MAG: UbiA family prenyltransferase [Verrucomicrobia bacterium]|nr:UbiA family prenyltransferase [Verrucomicrobiota bacterium]MCH8527043.1 UbiA family prenyltransferase [Kiritimatiellia bacterium]